MRRSFTLFTLLLPLLLLTGCEGKEAMSQELEQKAQVLEETETWFEGRLTQLKSTARQIRTGELLQTEAFAGKEQEKEYAGSEKTVVENPGEEAGGDFLSARAAIGLAEGADAELLGAQTDRYAFSCLNAEEQLLYVDMVQILSNMAENIEIRMPQEEGRTDTEIIGRVFQCVMDDHPEFFYTDGYTYTRYTEGNAEGKLIRITFSGNYTMSPAKRKRCEEKIDDYTRQVLADVAAEASEYEKVKYVYEYVILHTDYKQDAKENQNICSVFLYGESVCQGYAKAVQYLLQRMGLQAALVTGSVEEGEGHAWNLVRVDGAYYYVDATWGDASYEMSGEKTEDASVRTPKINYDYLCVTTEQLEKTHVIDSVVTMPCCTAVEANYYQQEDAYFTGYDREHIRRLFERAYERGDEIVTLKCSDSTAYEEVRRMLLDAQEVFGYLKATDGRVAYTENREQFSISFWL